MSSVRREIPVPDGLCLITGGCGFIGSHIAETLVRRGVRVRILDNFSTGRRRNVSAFRKDVEIIEGDIRNLDQLARALKGVDTVFHKAALVSVFQSVEQPGENHDINITGTLNVLRAAHQAGARRLVFASSAAVYGNDPKLPKQEAMRPQPASPYAIGKIAGEYYLSVYAQLYGLETVALRYFNVYGPRQDPSSPYSGVISRFVDAFMQDKAPSIYGDGKQTRDFVCVADVVQANLRAATTKHAGRGEALNVGTGMRTSLLDLLRVLGKASGKTLKPNFHEARAGDIRDSVSDITRAMRSLDYKPEWSLEKGLAALWNHAVGKKAT